MNPEEQQSLVIGYGNPWRGDDGAGPAVAERIAALGLAEVSALACHQLTPDLAEPISRARCVVFVDAACPPISGVRVSRVPAERHAGVMTHSASPGTLLALAELLYGRAPPAWLVAIEGRDFTPAAALSEVTSALIDSALERVLALLPAQHAPELAS